MKHAELWIVLAVPSFALICSSGARGQAHTIDPWHLLQILNRSEIAACGSRKVQSFWDH
jgi:hypothetical protein